jgi:ribonuclease-3
MLESIQTKIGFVFSDENLLELALTHKSFDNKSNNERLEFLGDTILNSIISQYLFLKYPEIPEGLLSRIRSQLVKSDTLSKKAKFLKLHKAVRLSKGTMNINDSHKKSIYEGCFEALIGAVYIDGGWNQATLVTINIFSDELNDISTDDSFKDPKTELQELFQSLGMSPPVYDHEEKASGFECTLVYENSKFTSFSSSKQSAETKVAALVLSSISKKDD